jgi:hypothetical protein
MVPASSRVHVQEVRGGIAHNPQDMRMSSEEERWLRGSDFFPGVRGVIARVPANVSHVDPDAKAVPVEVFGDVAADFVSVDIAVDGAERLESLKLTKNVRSEITGVPNFVTFGEVLEDGVVEKSVRVGHEANAHASGIIIIACTEGRPS